MEVARSAHDSHRPPHRSAGLSDIEHPRSIRSFARRGGRVTDAQERALETLWPKYGIELDSDVLDLAALFGRRAPVIVEIGFGNGDNLAAMAAAHIDCDYLGIEVHKPGVGRLLQRLEKGQTRNVRLICHDAVEVFQRHLPSRSLAEVLILFPDPWPKKRHHKRRLMQSPFLELVLGRLCDGGMLHFATDWQPYAEEVLDILKLDTRWENMSPEGTFVTRPAERHPTRFEMRGERLGHKVWDLAFRTVHRPT